MAETENIILDIKPISFAYRFAVMFFPGFLIVSFVLFGWDFLNHRNNPYWLEVLASMVIIFGIRSFRWAKNYITKISISDNVVEITMKKYDEEVVCSLSLNEMRAAVSYAVPFGGRLRLFLSQKVKKENLLQYQMGEWTKDELRNVAQILTDCAKAYRQ